MSKKKNGHKGGGKKNKNPGTHSRNSQSAKSTGETSETPVESGFTEVKRRNKVPKAPKKDPRVDLFASFGLQIRKINGDGNCLFRAFSDQLDGSEKDHHSYRKTIVQHLISHKDEYSGFHELEEEKSFDDRLKKLAKPGTYGGQECLVAFARIYRRVVYVHQPNDAITLEFPPSQRTDLRKFKQVHIMYTGGNHYDSIRLLSGSPSPAAAVLFTPSPEKGGIGTYSRDTRPDEIISETTSDVLEHFNELSLEDVDFTPEDEEEKDSAVGSECSSSASSLTSSTSLANTGESSPKQVSESETVSGEVLQSLLPPDVPLSVEVSADPSLSTTLSDTTADLDGVPLISPAIIEPPVVTAKTEKKLVPTKSLSRAEIRRLKKQQKIERKNTASPPASPNPVASLTSGMTQLAVMPRVISV